MNETVSRGREKMHSVPPSENTNQTDHSYRTNHSIYAPATLRAIDQTSPASQKQQGNRNIKRNKLHPKPLQTGTE